MNSEQFQQAAGLSATTSANWFAYIDLAMKEFRIILPIDKAMFIAQVGHESASFAMLVESFNYSVAGLSGFVHAGRLTQQQANMLGRHPNEKVLPLERQRAIANLVYNKRLGNVATGDGWKYRGRGLIQITGRDNYRKCGAALHVDLVNLPDLLMERNHAARSAAWFYTSKGCLNFPGDVKRITQIINGGQNGFNDRLDRFKRAQRVLT